MTRKKFEIAARPVAAGRTTTPAHDDAMERFIAGEEPMTTMTFQLPVRLKRGLKRAAMERQTTVKALLIDLIARDLAQDKQ